jgi:hypothetical protein
MLPQQQGHCTAQRDKAMYEFWSATRHHDCAERAKQCTAKEDTTLDFYTKARHPAPVQGTATIVAGEEGTTTVPPWQSNAGQCKTKQ